MHSLQNKIIIVTGGVGNLGAAVGAAILQAGGHAVLADRSLERLIAAYPNAATAGSPTLVGDVDLSKSESVAELIRVTLQRFGRIDGLVNTVGTWRGGKAVHEAPVEDWNFLYDLNVRTTLLTSRAVLPSMLRQGSGKIVNVAARSALHADAGSAAYSAAKSAVLRLTEGISAEVKNHGVNVNCVLPSVIDTPQNRAAMPAADHSKWVAPAAIADVIAFLLSDAARAIHGASLPVYGLS